MQIKEASGFGLNDWFLDGFDQVKFDTQDLIQAACSFVGLF